MFLGTSRFYYAVSPKIFDNITRENGVPTRTFNFGVDGMHPPESFYVLEQILKTEPRKLKWVFLEVGNIQTHSSDLQRSGNALRSVVLALGVVHWLNARGTFAAWWRRGPDQVFAAVYGCTAAIILLFVPPHYTPFIYFQF